MVNYFCKFVAICVKIATIMNQSLDMLRTTLKQSGFSLTAPRLAVFCTLQGAEPQTMHEVITHCTNINRASIYRTISLFEELDIVQRLPIGWKYKLELTGMFAHHHHHLSCNTCGRIIVLPEDNELEARLLSFAEKHNFTAQDHQLEIRGLCAQCQA